MLLRAAGSRVSSRKLSGGHRWMNATRSNSFPHKNVRRQMRIWFFPSSSLFLLISLPEASREVLHLNVSVLGRTPRKKPQPPPGGMLLYLSGIHLGVRTLQMSSWLGRSFAKSHFSSPGLSFLSRKWGVWNDTLLTFADLWHIFFS